VEGSPGAPGEGRLRFVRAGERTVLHTAAARSPLKLLLPKNHGHGSWVYVATLGGGLVDGDAVALSVDLERGACALLGTQASTKVYRSPAGTAQTLDARVASGALLALLPDPVSCFAGARYEQSIDVHLEDDDATLVLVDALTCGRAARGERWAFARYASRTRVCRAGRLMALDATLLDPAHGDLAARMGRFDAMATVLAVGPRAGGVRAALLAAAASPPAKNASLLCSATALLSDATLGRVAASSAQEAIAALRALALPVARELGDDPFARRW
jgi:urease accessory protein